MYKIGIVGAGAISVPYKTAITDNPECVLAAVCDVAAEKAKSLAEGTAANIYTDYMEMAEKERLDAVVINLPHFLHEPASVYFLDRKINVLVEKPMANTVSECDNMALAEKRNGVYLAIGHLQRYFPCYRALKKIVEDGSLGRLCLITETRNTDYFTNRPAWFLNKKQAGGGIVMNYCAHTLDKIFHLAGCDVESVKANTDNFLNDCDIEAQAQALIKMKNGVSAALSYCSSRIIYIYESYFYFTDGVVKIENNKDFFVSKDKKPFEKIELSETDDALKIQFNEFIKLISGEKTDIVRAPYARKVIETIENIFNN